MPIPSASFLSETTETIRMQLANALFAVDSAYEVIVDSPAAVRRIQEQNGGKGCLNLFFYRFDPSGFYPDGAANERWYVRARCLVTAFSVNGQEVRNGFAVTVPSGEIDLRVLGSVMRHYHDNPVVRNPARDLHLEVVPGLLSSEEINQIWASQQDVPYRPSLLYEFALVAIEPKTYGQPSPPVVAGGTGQVVGLIPEQVVAPAGQEPVSPYMELATGPRWAPLISFVTDGPLAVQALSVPVNPQPSFDLWIAAPLGAQVRLIWQQVVNGVWTDMLAPGGWPTVAAPAQPAGLGGVIDPDRAADAALAEIDAPSETPGTYLLYAAREDPPAAGLFLRSNPLIVHLQEGP